MICKNQIVGRTKEGEYYQYPCGQCLNCRINDIRAWYVRSHFECKKLERPFQYFLTLTYDDEHLPEDKVCNKRDLKLFLNNLNTSFGLKIRYYACSDYGSINNRAHYHAIILSTKKITQSQVERIWKKGFVYLKPMNKNNLKYTLRYTVKKRPMDTSNPAYFRLVSKGWGNNVNDYFTGQEYFVIEGKKYGIGKYLAGKLGLDKKTALKTKYFDVLYATPNYKYVGNCTTQEESDKELYLYRRRLK